jgi:signal peptidase
MQSRILMARSHASRGASGPGYRWVAVLGVLLAAYLIIYVALPHALSGFGRTYVAQPIVWLLLAAVAVLVSAYGRDSWSRLSRTVIWMGLLLGAFHLACLVIAGLLTGFGESPYIHRPYPIFLGFLVWAPALAGIEFSRAYLLRPFSERRTVLMVGLLTVLYSSMMIPAARFSHLEASTDDLLPFFGGTYLPLLSENLLTCTLALLGGPLPAIAYRGMLEAFEWLSPILPDFAWTERAFVGTLVPVAGFLVLQTLYPAERETTQATTRTPARKAASLAGWVATGIVVVAVVWASLGLLGFRPVSIVSGSMAPALRVGDLVIVQSVPAIDIEVGDVIQYRDGDRTTIHRVVEVRSSEGPTVFVTKGDANSSPDPRPVSVDQILGRARLSVPKIGWLPIGVKSFASEIRQLFT